MKQKEKWILNARTLSNLFVVLVGIVFYLVISHFDVVRSSVAGFLHILTPFIIGFSLASHWRICSICPCVFLSGGCFTGCAQSARFLF